MLGRVIVSCIMPWRSSFPCHRMCCGPDTLLWFALSVFRVADMIGIDGHVSFLPHTKKKKRYRCGGTGLLQGSGLFVCLPFRRAIARLVPSVCRNLPSREGGLYA